MDLYAHLNRTLDQSRMHSDGVKSRGMDRMGASSDMYTFDWRTLFLKLVLCIFYILLGGETIVDIFTIQVQ